MNYKSILFGMGIAVALLISFLIGRNYCKTSPYEVIREKVDTLVIHDTMTSYEPIFVDRKVIERVAVPVLDSVRIHDTTFVYLEREQVVWRDSLAEVYASGIMPEIDSVRHFTAHQVITIETTQLVKQRTHWGFGVQAGMGAGKGGFTPYIGVGVSYNLLSW